MKRVLLVDGSNLLFRGYHAITSRSSDYGITKTEDGADKSIDIPISVFVISFLQSLKNYIAKFNVDETYVAWDKKLLQPSTNFRKETKTVNYKANRDPEISKKVFESESIISPIITSLGIKVIYPRVMEADDVIAWLSHKLKDHKLTIISVDKDLAQLITPNCIFYNPIKDFIVTPDSFEDSFNVPQNKYLLYKAIVGDTSDNIDGLDGYGKVKGKKLALEWDTTTITDKQRTAVETNIKLIDLAYGYTVHPEEVVSYQEQFDLLSTQNTNFKEFTLLVEQYKLTQIKNQIEKWRGTFIKGPNIGTTPINSYLKNLFS